MSNITIQALTTSLLISGCTSNGGVWFLPGPQDVRQLSLLSATSSLPVSTIGTPMSMASFDFSQSTQGWVANGSQAVTVLEGGIRVQGHDEIYYQLPGVLPDKFRLAFKAKFAVTNDTGSVQQNDVGLSPYPYRNVSATESATVTMNRLYSWTQVDSTHVATDWNSGIEHEIWLNIDTINKNASLYIDGIYATNFPKPYISPTAFKYLIFQGSNVATQTSGQIIESLSITSL